MHYKIHEVAKMMGISPQTLRFYEQYGILPHERIGEGKYRQYSDVSVDLLMSLRKCRNCGFTVAQTAELLKSQDSTHMPRMIAEQAEKLKRHAELELRIAQSMSRAAERAATLEERLGCFVSRERPQIYWLQVKQSGGDRPSAGVMEHIGTLSDWLPLITWVMRMGEDGKATEMGFAAEADTAEFLGFDRLPGVVRLPACSCMYVLMRWPSGEAGAQSAVSQGLQTLRELGIRVTGTPMVSTLWNLRGEGQGTTYGEGWYPVE